MTKFQTNIQFQPMTAAEEILTTLYTETSTAIDQHNFVNAWCNMYIPKSKKITVFVEVQIDVLTADVRYYVASSKHTAKRIPALDYMSAVRELRQLLA